ncbi:peroxisome biogenesis factor 10 [Elasticomyces elasticus]|nr:peroxisome biogenesis factor 10 [Elasticomyces elasticus]KAK3647643.1 peroxisome biogenesis factor 10 [Elasticomyces elasticus]KAK4906681.1 peroxisome biogenesis factor 10 [Elasticomyces elasticus]KAK5763714.1 peroxisome biogenesis factor 10 [Elasticomyces elasticus]
MSDHVRDSAKPGAQDASFSYPWAAAPDIIRSNQKDAYFQSMLLTHLSGVIRSLYGARTAHNWASEARTFTEFLYLGLTTFVGNRTLGEEYCDIVQVEDDTSRLPSITRRSGYIVSSILLPYILTRFLPAFRRRLRAKLEGSMRKSHRRRASSPTRMKRPPTRGFQLQEYILTHLDSITSPAPVYAVSLAVFYFSGAYYQLSKRVFGLRYIFTRKLEESEQRVGYEVLGVLLVLQMVVQGYLHMQDTYSHAQTFHVPTNTAALAGGSAIIDGGVEIATDSTLAAVPLLFEPPQGADPAAQKERVSKITHTPLPKTYRYHLEDEEVMQWIDGKQQRKCTLCLDAMKDPMCYLCEGRHSAAEAARAAATFAMHSRIVDLTVDRLLVESRAALMLQSGCEDTSGRPAGLLMHAMSGSQTCANPFLEILVPQKLIRAVTPRSFNRPSSFG